MLKYICQKQYWGGLIDKDKNAAFEKYAINGLSK